MEAWSIMALDSNLNGALFIFMQNIRLPDFAIAEEIADRTKAPYEVCLKCVREMRKLPEGLPIPRLLIEGSQYCSRRKR